LLSFSFL